MALSRRSFVKHGSLWVAAAVAGIDLGCTKAAPSPEPRASYSAPSGTAAAMQTAQAPQPVPQGPPAQTAGAGVCVTTEANIEGPYYRDGAPMRAALADAGTKGVPLVLRGRVLSADCRAALAGALLDVWQADADGHYDNDGHDGRAPGPLVLRGKLVATASGSYEVRTIIPGRYLNGPQYRPAHIHVKVAAPGYRPLTTQLYFEGDPYNGVDPFIRQSLVMKVGSEAGGIKASTFDFVLRPA